MVQTAKKNGIESEENRKFSRGILGSRNLKIGGEINSDNYNIFTISRNPWDRFISSLTYYAALKKQYFEDMFLNKDGKLNMKKLETLHKQHGQTKGTSYSHVHLHVFCGIHTPVKGISDFTILRYEHLQSDILKFCKSLDLVTDVNDLQVINRMGNKTKRNHYTNYYDDISKQFVYDLFEKDIKMFDYFYNKQVEK